MGKAWENHGKIVIYMEITMFHGKIRYKWWICNIVMAKLAEGTKNQWKLSSKNLVIQ
jgi:hypothetical protein